MSNWITIPCLLALRDEFNKVNPKRDKGADGTIGDTAHAAKATPNTASDHMPDEDFTALRNKDADSVNEVHALDIDSSGPWPFAGWFDRTVKAIVAEEKRRWLDPKDVCRLEYVIWDRQIYKRSNNFNPTKHTGDDPHTNHAHFSGRYLTQAENDTSPWGVAGEDDDMPTAQEIAKAVWEYGLDNPYSGRKGQPALDFVRYAPSRSPIDAIAKLLGSLPQDVLRALAAADQSDAEVAAALKAALGDRAQSVFKAGLGQASSS